MVQVVFQGKRDLAKCEYSTMPHSCAVTHLAKARGRKASFQKWLVGDIQVLCPSLQGPRLQAIEPKPITSAWDK